MKYLLSFFLLIVVSCETASVFEAQTEYIVEIYTSDNANRGATVYKNGEFFKDILHFRWDRFLFEWNDTLIAKYDDVFNTSRSDTMIVFSDTIWGIGEKD